MKTTKKTNERKQQAQFLYMAGNKSQKEIADLVGVCERTIHSWIHQYAWDKLRLAAFQAPITIGDNLAAQIVELQNSIKAREPNNRFSNMQEAEITRKLITCYEKMKKFPSLSQSMQVLETLRSYIRPIDNDFARELGRYTSDFLEAKAANGYAPYQIEYGVEAVSPIMPGYEEVEGLDANKKEYIPCPDHLTCLYPGKCNYPYCMKEKEREITIDDYKVTPVLFSRSNPQENDIAAIAPSPLECLQDTIATHGVGSAEEAEETNADMQLPTANCKLPTEVSRSNPAIATSENRKNDISVTTQKTKNETPQIPNYKSPIPPQEPSGFNRDRFMELLKKLNNIVHSDEGITASTGSDPAIPTSENRRNEHSANPQITDATENNRVITNNETLQIPNSQLQIPATEETRNNDRAA